MTNDLEFFAGSGAMAELMRNYDWAQTPLGPPEAWPQSLKTTVRIMLTSRYAMWMAWSDELTFFYNDAYRPTLGVKSAWALGARTQAVWAEIWPDIGPRIEKVLQTGEATWDEGLMLFLERSGYPEETYHTFSYSPLADDNGSVSGMLCVVTEETERIIGERRLALLREVAEALTTAQTQEEVFAAIAHCLADNSRDLPFTLSYLFDENSNQARLVSTSGVPNGAEIAIPVLEPNDVPWPIEALITDSTPVLIDDLSARFRHLPSGPWDRAPQQAVLFPIAQPGQERPAGFLVAGINPYRKFEVEYRDFIGLLVGQLAASLANARAYEEEKKRAEALAELDRAKTTFFSNVSHEFRTPLTLMLGPLEDALAAPEDELTPQHRELLSIASRNSQRLLKLVNTLLDFTRIEAGRVQASYTPTDLAAYTAELASVFRSAVEKAGMQLIVDCDSLSQPVYIDRDMWEKMVLNLLSNAFKFTLEGEIEVTLREEKSHAVLTVRDTGTGISTEQLPHIFERFHRVEGARARTQEGTGIGLALVQELARLHGGQVAVESVYGQGTTFTVTLPLGTAHLPQERILAAVTLPSTALGARTYVDEALRWLPEDGDTVVDSPYLTDVSITVESPVSEKVRARILLVDDNADMREYVQRLLAPQYEVSALANGAEALRAIHADCPDLVLSDVMMPELDGFGLLQALRADPDTAGVPVILLSARAGEEARIEGLAAGADDYLTKPFSARELLGRVSAHLELSRVRREAEQAIRESKAQLQTLFEEAPIGIYLIDADFCMRQINPAAYPVFGDISNLIGRDFAEVIRVLWEPDYAAELIGHFRNTLETGEPYYAPERIERRLDRGVLEYYEWQINRIPLPEGSYGVVCYFRDVSRQVLARQEVESLNIRLQRAMTETHHRVKNNLQLISALIDMHCDTRVEMVPMEELTRLAANVRALAVIHDILTQEAKSGSDQETLSIKSLLEKLTQGIQHTMGGRKLHASIEEVRLVGRQATTLALITNELISNALKHGKGDTEVIFRVDGERAILEVCDDGPGFPPNFNQQTAANTGLELVQNITQWDLHGQIAYTNRPQGGARIIIEFPIVAYRKV